MQGKRGLVLGLANERSLAWGIARALHREGAELVFTFPSDAIERRMRPLAEQLGAALVERCDVTDDAHLDRLFARIAETWGRLDFLVHSVAFAQTEHLRIPFIDTPREGFQQALDASTYSLVACARRAAPLMADHGGAMLTLTYLGAVRVLPGYNVMGVAKAALEACVRYLAFDLGPRGIRINAISSGPIKTLSSAAVPGLRDMLRHVADRAPLRRGVNIEEIGELALWLLSDRASALTGEIVQADAGYSLVGW